MVKTITISNAVLKRLDKIRDMYWDDEQDKISYSDTIKLALKGADMWKLKDKKFSK